MSAAKRKATALSQSKEKEVTVDTSQVTAAAVVTSDTGDAHVLAPPAMGEYESVYRKYAPDCDITQHSPPARYRRFAPPSPSFSDAEKVGDGMHDVLSAIERECTKQIELYVEIIDMVRFLKRDSVVWQSDLMLALSTLNTVREELSRCASTPLTSIPEIEAERNRMMELIGCLALEYESGARLVTRICALRAEVLVQLTPSSSEHRSWLRSWK